MIADLILIDETAPNLLPRYDLPAALVYAANGSEVTDVFIDGKCVMRKKELLTIDEERVFFETERFASAERN